MAADLCQSSNYFDPKFTLQTLKIIIFCIRMFISGSFILVSLRLPFLTLQLLYGSDPI